MNREDDGVRLLRGIRIGLLLGTAATALALASCVSPFQATYQNRIAVVDSVAVPDTVVSRRAFAITIWTEGPNLCWKKGSDDVRAVSGGALITPYERAYVGGGACAQAIARFTHVVSLSLGSPGTNTITIRRRLLSVTGADSIATIERTVVAN
jgi:hypothetical protein